MIRLNYTLNAADETGNVITGGEESSDVKDKVSKSADIPLQLMAVSRRIVSEVLENAIRCFEQLIHPTFKPEMRGENISETPEIPLQLVAVSRYIVSEVEENSTRSYEQLNHTGIKEERVNNGIDTHETPLELITSYHVEVEVQENGLQSCEEKHHVRTKRDSLALPTEASIDCMERQHPPMAIGDSSPVAMEIPAMIDSESMQDYKNVISFAVEMETSIAEERSLKFVKQKSTKNKKPSSRPAKTARNRVTPGGKKLQIIPRAPASKKPNARKQASHSLSSHRGRSARKGARNLLLAWQSS